MSLLDITHDDLNILDKINKEWKTSTFIGLPIMKFRTVEKHQDIWLYNKSVLPVLQMYRFT